MTRIVESAPAPEAQTRQEARREWRITGVVFFGLIALAVIWAAAMIVRPFLSAILIGGIVVTLSFPTYRRVRERLNGRSGLAAALMLVGITIVLIIPAVVLTALLVQQANVVIDEFQSGEMRQTLQKIDLATRLQWVKRYVPQFDPNTLSVQRLVFPVLKQVPGWVAAHGGAVLGGLAGTVVGFFLILLSAFFFYVEGEFIVREMEILSPLPPRYTREFGSRFKDVVDATFRGQIITALAQGTATAIGLMIAGVKGAVFWGAVAAVLSLLPMVGAAVVWVPATIYLFFAASMGERGYFGAIFLAIWGVAVVSMIDNVVRPWAMRGKAQLPAIPLLFAVLGGLQAFGFVGLVVGPLVFSFLMAVIDIYKKAFQESEEQPGS
ncbi:MAG TPA: AI-2E family transporter [Thermoanaerobaculia bacterium]|nr:AI-2E family transporter [Thermoanaerobaculia bacterium]